MAFQAALVRFEVDNRKKPRGDLGNLFAFSASCLMKGIEAYRTDGVSMRGRHTA
jgi:hypothetical protein